jgi:hypothetical protein
MIVQKLLGLCLRSFSSMTFLLILHVRLAIESDGATMCQRPQTWKLNLLDQDGYPLPTWALLGGSNTTVTRRFPQAGDMRRVSSGESGKFGPRVQTTASLWGPGAGGGPCGGLWRKSSSVVSCGSTATSTLLSRKFGSYCSRQRPRSHPATSMAVPHVG